MGAGAFATTFPELETADVLPINIPERFAMAIAGGDCFLSTVCYWTLANHQRSHQTIIHQPTTSINRPVTLIDHINQSTCNINQPTYHLIATIRATYHLFG